jgi:feruloyl esterase
VDSFGDQIHDVVWLPQSWNGNFEGVGGGGFSCGPSYSELAAPIEGGYASATTDCGTTDQTGQFALNADGTLNLPLLDLIGNGSGIHDMTVVAKAVIAAYYAHGPQYSLFNGCSAGGGEGLDLASSYPSDYNGILAGSPATYDAELDSSFLWPELVMKESNDFLPTCKETAFTEAAIAACDANDAVTDGIISDPADCHWNPYSLVGLQTPCGTITTTDAAVVEKIWQGPVSTTGKQLWFGLSPGSSFADLAATTTTNGVTTGDPIFFATTFLGEWVQQITNWNWQTVTYQQYDALFAEAQAKLGGIIDPSPNLNQFGKDGGKLLMWQGTADPLVLPQDTLKYYSAAQEDAGGASRVDTFARLFLAPGAGHCSSAVGPAPSDPFGALAQWVENGHAPVTIAADVVDPATNVTTATHKLCMYPLVARYSGHGSTNDAANFTCSNSYT